MKPFWKNSRKKKTKNPSTPPQQKPRTRAKPKSMEEPWKPPMAVPPKAMGARKNTHHTDAGIGSSRPERVHSSQAVDAKERVLSRVSLQFSAAAFSKMSPD